MTIPNLDAFGGRWKRYPEYRAVHTETLRELPAHWRMNRLKFATRINSDVLGENVHPDHEVRYIDIGSVDSLGRIAEIQTFRFEDAPSRARRQVRHGDVLISTVRTYLRAITAIDNPPENLIASTGFAVLRAGKEFDWRFLWRLIQSDEFVDSVVNHSEGVGYPAINPNELGALPVWIPPMAEQQAIAAFLGRETARIDALIAHKERLIALLEEKRQAVISQAVTGGLDLAGALKDSGVPWIGDVPSSWTLGVRLKSLALPGPNFFTNGPFGSDLLTSELQQDGIPVIYIRDLNPNCYRRESLSSVSEAKSEQLKRFHVIADDILIAKVGDPPGFACTYPHDEPEGIICQDVIRLRPRTNLVNPSYLCFWLNSTPGIAVIDNICVQLTRKRFTLADLQAIRIPLPPLEEQLAIAQFLEAMAAESDGTIRRIRDGIIRLQEYRSALISAAVTGQIDVRGEVTL